MIADICQTERWSFQNRGVDLYLAAHPDYLHNSLTFLVRTALIEA